MDAVKIQFRFTFMRTVVIRSLRQLLDLLQEGRVGPGGAVAMFLFILLFGFSRIWRVFHHLHNLLNHLEERIRHRWKNINK